jgi:hypothetical protein
MALVGIVLATGWSIGTTDYRFAQGDDAWQAPMVLHLVNPALLNRDPLITEIGVHYRSGLFSVIAGCARILQSPKPEAQSPKSSGEFIAEAYAILFVLNRFLSIAAFYYLTHVATQSRTVGMVGAFLFAGFGYYSFGTYLGGTPLLEEKLVPRAFAVPFVLLALAACIRRQHVLAAIWLGLTAIIHPVTGVNVMGIYVVYTLLDRRPIAWRQFALALALLAALVIGIVYWTGAVGGWEGDGFIDPQWRQIIAATVGPWVFVTRDTAWALPAFPMALLVGLGSVWATKSPQLRGIYSRFVIGGLLAIVLHFVAVDWLGCHALLEACPERATIAVVAFAGVALSALIARAWHFSGWVGRIAAVLLFLAVLLRLPFVVTGFLFLVVLVLSAPHYRPFLSVAALAMVTVIGILLWRAGPRIALADLAVAEAAPGMGVLGRLSHGFRQLAALGIDDADMVRAQQWIRDHSAIDDLVLPPIRSARGWEIFSERSCPFNSSFHTYTHLSRDLAIRYEALARRMHDISWQDFEAYAGEIGARWVIIDARGPLKMPAAVNAIQFGPYEVHAR